MEIHQPEIGSCWLTLLTDLTIIYCDAAGLYDYLSKYIETILNLVFLCVTYVTRKLTWINILNLYLQTWSELFLSSPSAPATRRASSKASGKRRSLGSDVPQKARNHLVWGNLLVIFGHSLVILAGKLANSLVTSSMFWLGYLHIFTIPKFMAAKAAQGFQQFAVFGMA